MKTLSAWLVSSTAVTGILAMTIYSIKARFSFSTRKMATLALSVVSMASFLISAAFADGASDAKVSESVSVYIPAAGTSILLVTGTPAQVITIDGDNAIISLKLQNGYSVQTQIPTKYLTILPPKKDSLTSSVVSSPTPVAAPPVKLPAIFSDHMVVQRGIPVPVWGWAGPNEPVTVSIGLMKASTRADQDGKWMVHLVGLNHSDTPVELNVVGQSNQITIHDVLIGDVWVCAGQSNMSFPLNQASTAKEELPQSDHSEIRFFVPTFHSALVPQTDSDGKWVICTSDTAKSFSAVGYYFSKEIALTEKVPVGMIGLYGGDTPAPAWTSLEACKPILTLKKPIRTHSLRIPRG